MSAQVEPVAPDQRLRIAILGDFDGVHTRAWLRWFVERGHEVHAISYYAPTAALGGVTFHILRGTAGGAGARRLSRTGRRPSSVVPPGLLRLVHGARYLRAGIGRLVRELRPDVFHGHFLVEHGFYGALAGFHPYVVTAWGSDVLVEPERDIASRLIAKWTLGRADLATSNNRYMADRMIALGAPPSKVAVVTLGADRFFLEQRHESVNLIAGGSLRAPTVLSTRAHEPLYNIGELIEAHQRILPDIPELRLLVANTGSLTDKLRGYISRNIEFLGFAGRDDLRDAMTSAEIFVSVPSSDGTSVALLQAMAAGCFPIVSDLPTQRELVEDGVNGFRVPVHRPDVLASRIREAIVRADLRRSAAMQNRAIIEERGLNENEMAKMEALYWSLRPPTR